MHRRFALPLSLALTIVAALPAQARGPNHRVVNHPLISGSGGFGTLSLALRDHDGDGFEDYAVAAPNASVPAGTVGPGVVYVHSGRNGNVIRSFSGDQIGARFGEGLADPGDINGDFVPDLVVGAMDHDAASNNGGRVYAFSGLDGSVLWTMDGTHGANLGEAMTAIGDLSGDGIAELAIGEPGYSVGLLGRGRVVIVNGATGGSMGTGEGQNAYSDMGSAFVASPNGAAYVSDVKGRVYVIGAPVAGTVPLALAYDRPAGADGIAEMAPITGPGGAARLIIGRRYADTNGLVNNGTLELFEGGAALLTIEGTSSVALLGARVAAGRDVDGDGLQEIIYTEYNGSPLQADPVTVMRQDGAVVEVLDIAGISAGTLFSIADTTGDGRGEWGASVFHGGFGMSECQLYATGLEEPTVSLPGGGLDVDYTFDLGSGNAGSIYWAVYSLSGTDPGTVFSPAWPRFPLNVDAMTNVFWVQANSALFPDMIGTLDAGGGGATSVVFPASLAAFASGWALSNCVVAFGPGGFPPTAVSNPRTVVLP